MIKLLMVTHYFDSHPGGIEIVARNLYHGFVQRQCPVDWAAAAVSPAHGEGELGTVLPLKSWNGVEQAMGVPFPVPSPSALIKLKKAIDGADLVLMHDCLYLTNIAAMVMSRLQRKPVIIVQHVGMVPYKNPVLRLMMKFANGVIARRMLAAASQVVFISDITRKYFDAVKFRRTPQLVFNGTDTDVYRPVSSETEKSRLREKLGLPLDRKIALFVGRFVEKKGLRVLREMAALTPEIQWTFAGSGPLDPGNWGLPNIQVCTGLKGAAVADLYRAADVFVLPSTGEGLPLVIQEALSCGVPVVCTDETATADPALSSCVSAVPLIPGDDKQSAINFTAALRDAISRERWSDKRALRHAFVKAQYSWASAVDRYLEIAEELTVTHSERSAAEREFAVPTSQKAGQVQP